jgi:hypothetical protein
MFTKVLSHWPWYDLLKDWLCRMNQVLCAQVADREIITSIERSGTNYIRCAINLVHEIPLPPPGKLEISIHIEGLTLFCSRPPVNTFSNLKNVN